VIVGRFLALLFPIHLFTPPIEAAFPFTGQVVAVRAGDTIGVLHNGKLRTLGSGLVLCVTLATEHS
jgi:hypothetical protein